MKKLVFLLVAVMVVIVGCAGTPGPFESPLVPGEIPELEFSGVLIAGIVAGLLSLALEFFPGLKTMWKNFQYKREVLAAAGMVVSFVLVGLYNVGAVTLIGFPEGFGWPTIWLIVEAWLGFIGAAQLTYTGVKRLNDS